MAMAAWVDTIVRIAKYASYCGLIFVDKMYTKNPQKFIHLESFYAYSRCNDDTT